MNHDSGKPIDDPIINLCDVLNNFEKSTKLLPDSNIWLYDNKYETCIQLSNILRNYFEEIVQPRRESSNDNEWFSSLDRFFKNIIARRTSRVQNWYMQNTANFPQDNSNVVNGNLIDKRNCQKVCSKKIGHDDNEHLCQSKRHYCGKNCTLSSYTQKGDYQCLNKCIMSYEEEHDLHLCENTICPIQCPIPNCKERCQSDDHFHAFSDLQVNHFCGNEHQCRELCEDNGICQVVTKPKEQEEIYRGLVEETSITFTKVYSVK
ncbi:unnamed protein product [Rhizophagus irregularis]|nr:unnamed protein product [Rhizophagus irregularis]